MLAGFMKALEGRRTTEERRRRRVLFFFFFLVPAGGFSGFGFFLWAMEGGRQGWMVGR